MNKVSWYYKPIMRMIDLGLAIFILVGLSWLLIIIFFWLKFDSRGPVIFRQERVGLDGKIFICNKFRTMQQHTDDVATHLVSASQVTRAGKFLRATKLDELPQAWNILLNEMAVVGPRPCLPNQGNLIAERSARDILSVKPGITGLSQIRNIDMSDPVKLAESDLEYLLTRSLSQDIKILILTAFGGGQGDKVVQKN